MSNGPLNRVLGSLRKASFLQGAADLTDGELLECYVTQRDEAAFEALVRRHGPMVASVCKRILQNPHDAEDAFQATFLVLARKAAAIVPRAMVGNWLYGAACLAAQKARAAAIRRRARERQVTPMPEPATVAEGLWNDLEPLLDQELAALPDKYRLPVVLCDLEAKTRKEAARQLGWPEGTVAGRLARGRAMLARRLTRRGLPCSGGVLAVVLSQNAAGAAVPTALVVATVKTAALVATGKAVAGTIVSEPVAAIAAGVMKAMLLGRLKVVLALLLILVLAGIGGGVLAHRASAGGTIYVAKLEPAKKQPPREPARGNTLTLKKLVVEAVNVSQRTISVRTRRNALAMQFELRQIAPGKFGMENIKLRPQPETRLQALRLAKGTRIVIKNKAAKLSDLKPGMRVTLVLGTDGEEIVVRVIEVD